MDKQIINWLNTYIQEKKIATDSKFVIAEEKLNEMNQRFFVFQDDSSNVIGLNLDLLLTSKTIPPFFIIEDNKLVGFDITYENDCFYSNDKFFDFYNLVTEEDDLVLGGAGNGD